MKKKFIYAETLFLAIVLAVLLLPGIYFVNLLAHESYHAHKHPGYAEKICINLGGNESFEAHTVVNFLNDTIKNYTQEMRDEEEKNASRVGRLAAIAYLVIFVVVAAWLLSLMRRHEEKHKKLK